MFVSASDILLLFLWQFWTQKTAAQNGQVLELSHPPKPPRALALELSMNRPMQAMASKEDVPAEPTDHAGKPRVLKAARRSKCVDFEYSIDVYSAESQVKHMMYCNRII